MSELAISAEQRPEGDGSFGSGSQESGSRLAGWVGRRPVLSATLGYLVLRLGILIVAVLIAQPRRQDLLHRFVRADALHYQEIAESWYRPYHAIPRRPGPLPNLVFFPGYPALIRGLHWVLGLVGLRSWALAELLVSNLAAVLAAALIALWALRRVAPAAAVLLVCGWALWPSGIVESMPYSEAPFVAAAAACLLALDRRRWWWAALAATAAGLIRPVGAALVLAVGIAVLLDVLARRAEPGTAGRALRAVAVTALASVGVLFSLGEVAWYTGRLTGWFWLESTVWLSGFDGGRSALQILTLQADLPIVMRGILFGLVLGSIGLAGWLVARRDWAGWPLITYTVVAGLMGLSGAHYGQCKARFLLVAAFPLLLPLAEALVQPRLRSRLRSPALLGVVVLVVAVAWEEYLLLFWRWSI